MYQILQQQKNMFYCFVFDWFELWFRFIDHINLMLCATPSRIIFWISKHKNQSLLRLSFNCNEIQFDNDIFKDSKQRKHPWYQGINLLPISQQDNQMIFTDFYFKAYLSEVFKSIQKILVSKLIMTRHSKASKDLNHKFTF